MLLTFSHIVDGQRVPLLDEEGREVTITVEASSRTNAMSSAEVKTLLAEQTDKVNVRVRRVF